MQSETLSIEQLKMLKENLNLLESLGIIDHGNNLNADMVIKTKEFRLKEAAVLKKHTGPSGKPLVISQTKENKRGKEILHWQTRTPWNGPHSKIVKNSYEEIIEALYSYYIGDDNLINATVAEIYGRWMKSRTQAGIVSSLTLEHNSADWERYWNGRPLSSKELAAGKKQFEASKILDMKISDVKASHIRSHYEYLTGQGNISKKAFNNMRGIITALFTYAYTLDIPCIDASVVSTSGLHFKEDADHSEEVYTPEERDALLTHLEGLKKQNVYTLSIRLMFCLCCRIGELRALKKEDVHISHEGSYVWLRHQIVDKRIGSINRKPTDVNYVKGRKKQGKRKFPLSGYAMDLIRQLIALNPDSEYICSNQAGNPIATNRFNEYLKRSCEACGIPYYSSHKIRFYAVSSMYDNGISENTIQRLAGHSNVSTTRHYNRKIRDVSLDEEFLEQGFGRAKLQVV